MEIKNITFAISITAWICLLIYTIVKYRRHKQMADGPLKKLIGEVIIIQIWILMIFMLAMFEKMDFIVAQY